MEAGDNKPEENMSKPLEEVRKLTIGQLAALVHAIGGPMMVKRVTKDNNLRKKIRRLIIDTAASPVYADLLSKGYRVLEDVAPSDFRLSDIKFVKALNRDEFSIKGDEIRARAIALGANLGLADGLYLLDHEEEICTPKYGHVNKILLPGTLFLDPDDAQCIVVISWDIGLRWHFIKLDLGVGRFSGCDGFDCCFASLKKQAA